MAEETRITEIRFQLGEKKATASVRVSTPYGSVRETVRGETPLASLKSALAGAQDKARELVAIKSSAG